MEVPEIRAVPQRRATIKLIKRFHCNWEDVEKVQDFIAESSPPGQI
jgi:hypothetical protein